jgi:hypothetical protein
VDKVGQVQVDPLGKKAKNKGKHSGSPAIINKPRKKQQNRNRMSKRRQIVMNSGLKKL